MTIGNIAKAISAAVVAGLTAAVTGLSDNGDLSTLEIVAIAGAFLLGLGAVWAVPNLPSGVARYGKAITAALVAALGSTAAALTDGGIATAEWVSIAIALIGGLGLTAIVPNAAYSDELKPQP